MNLIDVQTQIIRHFLSSETFDISLDLQKINFPEAFQGNKLEIVELAMERLEKDNIVKKVKAWETGLIKGWILVAPMVTNIQEVGISLPLSCAIASTINSHHRANSGTDEEVCNPLMLSERDIYALVLIVGELLEERDDKND